MSHVETLLVGSARLLYFLGHALGSLTVVEGFVVVRKDLINSSVMFCVLASAAR